MGAMNPRSVVAALSVAVGCLLACSLCVWIHLSEMTLAALCWPEDIHKTVVDWFGGDVVSKSGTSAVNISFVSILGRVAIAMTLLFALRWKRLQNNPMASDRSERGTGTLVREVFAPCARPAMMFAGWLVVWFVLPFFGESALNTYFLTASPYVMAIAFALLISGMFSADRSTTNSAGQVAGCHKFDFAVVLVGMLFWEATSFWMNERLYAGLLVPHGDSAMYEEHLWNVWHGKGFRSYLDQGLFLGEHIQVIHLLLLPLHMIWPSYLMMELVASSSLAICCIPIYSIARRHSGSSRAAMLLALAWLFYFPMHYLDIAIDLKTLRPSCYGMPFLFWGIDLAERRKFWGASTCLLIAMSTQEDFALIIGPIGFCLFLASREFPASDDRRRFATWSLGVLIFSVIYLLLAVLVVIPAFRGGAVVHYSRYFGDLGSSPGELIRTALRDPVKVAAVLLSLRTGLYVLLLAGPLAFAPLWRPKYLIAGVATFAMLSLIQLGNEANSGEQSASTLPPVPYHHFHAPLVPVIFWAAAASLKMVRPPADRARFMLLTSAFTAIIGSTMPIGAGFWSETSSVGWKNRYVPGPRAEEFSKVLQQIPQTARVASTDYAHTRFTHHERSYDYSGYLRAVNNYQPGVPADTDFIVIDTSHPYSTVRRLEDVRELNVEPDRWEVLPDETNGLFIVLKRR